MVNGFLTNYIITYSSTLDPTNVSTARTISTEQEYRITNLLYNTNYSIKVAAVNHFQGGQSGPTSPQIFVNLPEHGMF